MVILYLLQRCSEKRELWSEPFADRSLTLLTCAAHASMQYVSTIFAAGLDRSALLGSFFQPMTFLPEA
jgi:hypothetical protein